MAKLSSSDKQKIKDALAPLQTAIATLLAEIDDHSDKEEAFTVLDDIVNELRDDLFGKFIEIETRLHLG